MPPKQKNTARQILSTVVAGVVGVATATGLRNSIGIDTIPGDLSQVFSQPDLGLMIAQGAASGIVGTIGYLITKNFLSDKK